MLSSDWYDLKGLISSIVLVSNTCKMINKLLKTDVEETLNTSLNLLAVNF